jgi:hypothetical protein
MLSRGATGWLLARLVEARPILFAAPKAHPEAKQPNETLTGRGRSPCGTAAGEAGRLELCFSLPGLELSESDDHWRDLDWQTSAITGRCENDRKLLAVIPEAGN